MLFDLGSIVATPGCLRHCQKYRVDPMQLIHRHAAGDWGDIGDEDKRANVQAIEHGLRVFSSFLVGTGKIWCITESDRSTTCLLLPTEY